MGIIRRLKAMFTDPLPGTLVVASRFRPNKINKRFGENDGTPEKDRRSC